MLSRLFWREHATTATTRNSHAAHDADNSTAAATHATAAAASTNTSPGTAAAAAVATTTTTHDGQRHHHTATAAAASTTQLRPLTQVLVPSYRVRSNYIEYAVVCNEAHASWRVYRRYQQFKDLERALRQHCHTRTTTTTTNTTATNTTTTQAAARSKDGSRRGSVCHCGGALPVLPSSHWVEVTNQSVERVERRRRLLEVYLQQLLVPANHFYDLHSPLHRFLHDGKVAVPRPRYGVAYATHNNGNNNNIVNDVDDAVALAPLPGLSSHTPCAGMEQPRDLVGATTTPPVVDVHKHESASAAAAAVTATTRAATSPSSSSSSSASARRHDDDDDDNDDGANAHDMPAGTTRCLASSAHAAAPRALRFASDTHTAATTTTTTTTASMRDDTLTPRPSEERLPPCTATCTQCAAEYTSLRRPHRCYFCRCCVCSACLSRVTLPRSRASSSSSSSSDNDNIDNNDNNDDGAALQRRRHRCRTVVRACAQCSENCRRRQRTRAARVVAPHDRCRRCDSNDSATKSSSSSSSSSLRRQALSATRAAVAVTTPPAAAAATSSSSSVCLRDDDAAAATTLGRVSVRSFVLLTVLGQGTFGKVLKVRHRASGVVYAMKVLSKAAVRRRRVDAYVCEERAILAALPPHPYIVRCHAAFQTRRHLFFVFDYVAGGELYRRLYPRRTLSPHDARLYAAELVLALQHLHAHDVVHRDVKPENVLLDRDGHAVLADLGLARRHVSRTRRRSFVGSAEYVAPETIDGAAQTVAVDWWSVGVLLYEMLVGHTPFRAASNAVVYERVLHDDVDALLAAHTRRHNKDKDDATDSCRDGDVVLDEAAVSLLRGLLQRDVAARMRAAARVREHVYFACVDWAALQRRAVAAAYVPALRYCDTRYFRRRYTAQWAQLPPSSTSAVTTTTMAAQTAAAAAQRQPQQQRQQRDSFVGFDYVDSDSSSSEDDDNNDDNNVHAGRPVCVAHALSSTASWLSPSPLLRACSREVLCGAWRAVAVEVRAADGRVTYPWGGDVRGLLQYTSCTNNNNNNNNDKDNNNNDKTVENAGSGVALYYSMQLSAAPSARPPAAAVRASALEQAAHADVCDVLCSYVASCGTCVWHADTQCLQHTPLTHVMPDACGTPLRLGYELARESHNDRDDAVAPTPQLVLRLYTTAQQLPDEADVRVATVTTWVKLDGP